MGLQHEIWIKDIEDNLFEGSAFIQQSKNHDAFVSYKTVHVPQSGSEPNVEVDRSVIPAVVTQRTDSELTYNLREFTTDPVYIRDLDELQTSYAKRQSVLGDHINLLNQRMGDEVANIWASANADFLTTGAAGGALATGATGNRLKITKEDIAKLAAKLDKDNVPADGRFLLMPTELYYELFETDQLISREFMGNASSLPAGVINELFGFMIMKRNTVAMYDGAGAKKAVGAAAAADDNLAVLAFHKSFVSKALGGIKVYADEDKPEWYGSIFSAKIMLGATRMRADGKGIAVLAQGV